MTKNAFKAKIGDGCAHKWSDEETYILRLLPSEDEGKEELREFLFGLPGVFSELQMLRKLVKLLLREKVRLNGGWERDLGNSAKKIAVPAEALADVLRPLIKEIVEEDFGLEVS